METAPAAALVVPKPELLLELLVVALDPPAQLGKRDETIEGDGLGQGREPTSSAPSPQATTRLAATLAVFSISSIAALGAQLVRFAVPHSFILDLALISSGILLLVFTAWFVEWRTRSPTSSQQV